MGLPGRRGLRKPDDFFSEFVQRLLPGDQRQGFASPGSLAASRPSFPWSARWPHIIFPLVCGATRFFLPVIRPGQAHPLKGHAASWFPARISSKGISFRPSRRTGAMACRIAGNCIWLFCSYCLSIRYVSILHKHPRIHFPHPLTACPEGEAETNDHPPPPWRPIRRPALRLPFNTLKLSQSFKIFSKKSQRRRFDAEMLLHE